ncbi:MAG TPA: carbohydrate-binding family 9-like protein [Acidobacteriaceae bacterium]
MKREAGIFAGAVMVAAILCSISMAQPSSSRTETLQSKRASGDTTLNLDPQSAFWGEAPPISFDGDTYGRAVPRLTTEIRSRWTDSSLYLLFVCPYQDLNLHPSPQTKSDTHQLWNWDVAEIFIGSDFQHIHRYKEFELSPQGEWLDLDVDLDQPHREDGWKWNSGFETAARIDAERKVWYGAMRIPFSAIDPKQPHSGNKFRANFFRSQGASRQLLAWQAPMGESFHVPERFGILELMQ